MKYEAPKGHRWFAAVYDRMMASAEKTFMRRVRYEIAAGARGRVLEIGAGTGANFPYYSDATSSITATEPDPFMARRARERAKRVGLPIELKEAPAEALPFGDETFDTVVATLVLCSVRDPAKALDHAFGAFWQDVATPIWRWMGAGCHPNRDTAQAIREAGFIIRQIEITKPVPPVPPMVIVRPHVKGIALRP